MSRNICPEHGEFLEVFDGCPICQAEKNPCRQDIGPYLIFDEQLDSEEFYILCQNYRFARVSNQQEVTAEFEAIKNYLKGIDNE